MTPHTLLRPSLVSYDADEALRGERRTIRIERGTRARTGSGQYVHHYWSGHEWQLGTAAYWESLTRQAPAPQDYRLGRSLSEEIGACVLGGYGIPADTALAAFARLQAAEVFSPGKMWESAAIEQLLREPLPTRGGSRLYRFPHQKAVRLSQILRQLRNAAVPDSPRALRAWLEQLPGVGPKTASWIVRNHTSSSEVAIIDVHIVRAGTAAGVFPSTWRVSRDYGLFEAAFLQWAEQANLEAALLDACIWGSLARGGPQIRDVLGVSNAAQVPDPVWPIESEHPSAPYAHQ